MSQPYETNSDIKTHKERHFVMPLKEKGPRLLIQNYHQIYCQSGNVGLCYFVVCHGNQFKSIKNPLTIKLPYHDRYMVAACFFSPLIKTRL